MIQGQITVTKNIRYDNLWSVDCAYYSTTGAGVLNISYTNESLMVAMNEFNEHFFQRVIDFESAFTESMS